MNVNFSAVGDADGFTPSATSGNNLPFGTPLGLGPLANYGGPTQTIPLGSASPARNAGSNPANFIKVGTTIFFVADDGTSGNELWKTDGTMAGTVRVRDINPGLDYGVDDIDAIGGTLYLQASDGVHGFELWKSDATAAGTVQVVDLNADDAGGFGFLL